MDNEPVAPDERSAKARRRILEAAARCVARDGAAALSLNEVAREAKVSKSLILYHFADKNELLAVAVEQLARELTDRERTALKGAAGSHALDVFWRWLDSELRRGDLRTLLELGRTTNERVIAAARAAHELRRTTAASSVGHLFATLQIKPRVPLVLLADVMLAFVDGLALQAALDESGGARSAFDVFWLALLSLGE